MLNVSVNVQMRSQAVVRATLVGIYTFFLKLSKVVLRPP